MADLNTIVGALEARKKGERLLISSKILILTFTLFKIHISLKKLQIFLTQFGVENVIIRLVHITVGEYQYYLSQRYSTV